MTPSTLAHALAACLSALAASRAHPDRLRYCRDDAAAASLAASRLTAALPAGTASPPWPTVDGVPVPPGEVEATLARMLAPPKGQRGRVDVAVIERWAEGWRAWAREWDALSAISTR